MSGCHRLKLLQSHLVSRFPVSEHDSSLAEYLSRSQEIDKTIVAEAYFGSFYAKIIELRNKMCSSPLFDHTEDIELSREPLRQKIVEQLSFLYSPNALSYDLDMKNPEKKAEFCYCVGEYDQMASTRFIVHITLYLDTIQNLGTQKHRNSIDRAYALKDYGSFAMTELGHGSNVAGLETTATYDHKTREFIINSPKSTSAKWLIGAVGKTANMTSLFAKLVVDGVDKGIHAFLIPIRDYETHQPLPGVILGDCGKKNYLDGVDNGFLIFKDYRVPYDCLLDRLSQITPDGKFKSTIKNKEKRLGIMLGGLIRGRIAVVNGSEVCMRHSLTIALRFAAIKKQFSKQNGPEIPILDYQTQQFRLIPHLAKMFGIKSCGIFLMEEFKNVRSKTLDDPECNELAEYHSILSAMKNISSSFAVAATQECREATGGMGFQAYSRLNSQRNMSDVHTTWEGDNTVLIQQAGKFIFKQVQRAFKGIKISAPSLSYLTLDFDQVKSFKATFNTEEELYNEKLLIELMEYRVNWYLHQSIAKLQENGSKFDDIFDAWNNTQVHYLQELGKSFGECIMARELLKLVNRALEKDQRAGVVIKKLFYLFVLERIEKNSGIYLENAFNGNQIRIVKDAEVSLCRELAKDSLHIIDAIAAPDKILGSAIGNADGQMYTNMIKAVEASKRVYDPPTWLPILKKVRNAIELK